MQNKNAIYVFICLLFVLILTACSGGGNENSSSNDEYSIKIGYVNENGEPTDIYAKRWKELIEEETDNVDIELYPSSQLGSENEMIEQAVSGSNLFVATGNNTLAQYNPDIGILEAPYLTDSFEEKFYLTETDWYEDIIKDIEEEENITSIGTSVYGERHIMTNDEVKKPEDLEGMKIRVPDDEFSVKGFEALGASPTPLPLEDLYPSLQQGMVDGAENPVFVLDGSKTYEVTDYLALTGHQLMLQQWIAGTSYFDSLPDDLQDIIVRTGEQASEESMEVVEEESEEIIEKFEAEGIEVNEVDQEAFKKQAESFYDSIDNWSPGLYEEVQELLDNYDG